MKDATTLTPLNAWAELYILIVNNMQSMIPNDKQNITAQWFPIINYKCCSKLCYARLCELHLWEHLFQLIFNFLLTFVKTLISKIRK